MISASWGIVNRKRANFFDLYAVCFRIVICEDRKRSNLHNICSISRGRKNHDRRPAACRLISAGIIGNKSNTSRAGLVFAVCGMYCFLYCRYGKECPEDVFVPAGSGSYAPRSYLNHCSRCCLILSSIRNRYRIISMVSRTCAAPISRSASSAHSPAARLILYASHSVQVYASPNTAE